MASTTTAATAAPAQPNPEALEDAPRTAANPNFQNVDLEAGNAAATAPPVVATTTTTTTAVRKTTAAGTVVANTFDWGVLNYLLAFCALTEMVAASVICGGGVVNPIVPPHGQSCTQIPGYQVSVGTISAFFAILFGTLYSFDMVTDARVLEAVSWFQFLWWIAGTIVLTFFGSFITVTFANGYFATWGAFIFATLALVVVSPMFRGAVDRASDSVRQPLLFLIAASGIEMGAAIAPCDPQVNCYTYNAWALSMGTISLFIAIVLLLAGGRISSMILRVIGYFLIVWWVIGFGVVSFGGPFTQPGNGYFASLAAVYASVTFVRWINTEA